MCDDAGISNEKIRVYKIIDEETAPGGIVYKDSDHLIFHINSWITDSENGEEYEFKIFVTEMTEYEFENLPEF